MKCKKLTAILLSTVTLAATPSVPVLCNTVQNITITAAAASSYDTLIDSFKLNQLSYRIYQTTRGSKYAAVVSGDAGLTSLTIPAQVTYQNETYSVDRIEEGAFEGTDATSVSISSESCTIEKHAFYHSAVQSFEFSGRICTVEEEAFGESQLSSTRFGSKSETLILNDGSFKNTKNLSKVTFENPNVYLYLGNYAFDSSSIRYLALPASVTAIPEGCFQRCTNLLNLSMPSTVTSFGDGAFSNATLPSEMEIPASLSSIGYYAFAGARNVFEYILDDSNQYFCVKDGVLYARDFSKLYAYPANKTDAYFQCEAGMVLEGSISNNPYLKTLDFTKMSFTSSVNLPNLTNLERLYISDEEYARTPEEIFSRFYSLFSGTKLHCVNEEAVTAPPWDEPRLTGKLGSYLEENFEDYPDHSIMRYYVDAMADYVVRTETTPSMSQLEMAVVLHEWLCKRVVYNPDVMLYDWELEHDIEPDENLITKRDRVDASAFLNKKQDGKYYTVCEGYARCYKILMNKAGIPADLVYGKNKTEGLSGHVWNLIKLDGIWYHVDVTWDDCDYIFNPSRTYNGTVPDAELLPFSENKGRYLNFLCSDYQFERDNHWKYRWEAENHPELNWLDGAAPDKTQYMIGDNNHDFQYDERDLNRLQKYMLGQDPFANYEEWRIADMNGDGTVNVFDLTYMRRYLNLYKGTDYEGIWSPAAWKYSKLEK